MTEIEKLDAGLPYDISDPAVNARKLHAVKMTEALDAVPVTDHGKRVQAIRNLFGSVGKNPEILPGFHCDNGSNIHAGDDFLANYNVTILDIAPVYIGSHVLIGPNPLISTVNHPLSPAGRRKHLGTTAPVRIGDDVWIGGNVVVLPGVTIGDNVVIGAGSVVNKDIPSNSVAVGNPCKVIKEI